MTDQSNKTSTANTPDGPQKRDEHSRQMGMTEAEKAEEAIAADHVTGAGIDELIPDGEGPDRGVFRDERVENRVTSHTDNRSPNLPDHAHEDIDDPSTNALNKNTNAHKADPELLEDAYSQNDPGVETKK